MFSKLGFGMVNDLKTYLDTLVITSDNIGDIRRQCFVPWDSKWNGIVRDETAKRERPTLYRVVNTDNFGGDYPNEYFESAPLRSRDAHELAQHLNLHDGDVNSPRFHKVERADYTLIGGFEP